jgi:hypothetical protein
MTPPDRTVFLVHGMGHARAACAAAAEAGRPIALLSARAAGQFAGVGWFRALVEEARAEFPTLDVVGILDCGDAAGRAMQAMTQGVRSVVVDAASPALPRLRSLAARFAAEVLDEPPAHVDLSAAPDPDAAARAALASPAQD